MASRSSDQSSDQVTDQSTDTRSISQATRSPDQSPDRTDGRTDVRTKNLQDASQYVTFLNAHENGEKNDLDVAPIADTLAALTDQLTHAATRMPYTRAHETRGMLDPQVRRMVLLRDGFMCQWCKRHVREGVFFEVDHIVPWSAGGTNATDNLRTLCRDCNQLRSNRRTDADTASALLIVGSCPWCRGRHYISRWESEDGHSSYVYDEDAAEVASADREVPVWCIGCHARSSTSHAHADTVRAKQENRWAPADYQPSRTEDLSTWKDAGS